MNSSNETFVFGDEVRGRGNVVSTDLIVGCVLAWLSLCVIFLGTLNLIAIKKLSVFHNAFGRFWASRTVGEIGFNVVLLVYAVPLTLLQPKDIPVQLGIACFTIGYFFAHEACVMHQIVSLNRCIAVCFPLKYNKIYTTTTCYLLIAFCWIEVSVIAAAYHAIPCNLLGYSPRFYEFTFVKCSPDVDRDYSLVGTFVNRMCFSICALTVSFDLITLARIVYLHTGNRCNVTKDFQREIRFCIQSSLQNVTMMTALTWIIWINNAKADETFKTVLTLDALIFTHITNALVLIVVNPEVRSLYIKKLVGQSSAQIHATRTIASSASEQAN